MMKNKHPTKKGARKVKAMVFSLVVCLLVFATGCENSGGKSPWVEELDTLRLQKSELVGQVDEFRAENEQLKGQIKVLSGLEEQVKLANVHRLERIKIGRYTNLYDKDNDGKYEKLIVYIQPIDRDGDVVKAPGATGVELWDLDKEPGQALLGRWQVEAEQMNELWFSVLTTNYRLTFDLAEKISEYKEPLTVKATFTDHLSGRVFKEQKAIKPR
jgi:cell division protein FtsB